MARIKTTSKRAPSVKVTGARARHIAPDTVAEALGAEKVKGSEAKTQSPMALVNLRQELLKRLSSSGGRPGLSGTTRRQKIPLDDDDWDRLRQIAEALRDDDVRPTAGQVASVLLHATLKQLDVAQAVEKLRER